MHSGCQIFVCKHSLELYTDWTYIAKEDEVVTHQAAATHQLKIPTDWSVNIMMQAKASLRVRPEGKPAPRQNWICV